MGKNRTQSVYPNLNLDSLMSVVFEKSDLYNKDFPDYTALIYVKDIIEKKKINFLRYMIPFLPDFKIDKDRFIIENYSKLIYKSPNRYRNKLLYTSGTFPYFSKNLSSELAKYFNVNIYSDNLFKTVYSPLVKSARKYYDYSLDSLWMQNDRVFYKVRFTPIFKNYQLSEGFFVFSNEKICFLSMAFKKEYASFKTQIKMSDKKESKVLPERIDIDILVDVLGNKIAATCDAFISYKEIKKHVKSKIGYDSSVDYLQESSNYSLKKDSFSMSKFRPIPLTARDSFIYAEDRKERKISKDTVRVNENKVLDFLRCNVYGLGEFVTHDIDYTKSNCQRLHLSPLFNPFLLDYSSRNGLSYVYKIDYDKRFNNGKYFEIKPSLGYNFKSSRFYWAINNNYNFVPKKNAIFHINLRNGNEIETKEILLDLKDNDIQILDKNKINLEKFKSFNLNVGQNIEICNGFNLGFGLNFNKYIENKKSDFDYLETSKDFDISSIAENNYISSAPYISFELIPGQYYYYQNGRKIDLYSHYPSFSFSIENAIKGFFKGDSKYTKMEFDLFYKKHFSLMRNMYFRFGGGQIFNYNKLYFSEFENFRKSNIPLGWEKEMFGTFYLLKNERYTMSDRFIRTHLGFSSPFLLFPRLGKFNKYFPYSLKEKIYASCLYQFKYRPYYEFGYGVGTSTFNVGVFANYRGVAINEVGVKFSISIFDK